MINGPMSEAQKGYAVLEDVDAGTFTRFSRWAYNGYYFPAAYSIASKSRMASTLSDILVDREGKLEQRPTLAEMENIMEPDAIPTDPSEPMYEEPTEEAPVSINPFLETDEWGGFSGRPKKDKIQRRGLGFGGSTFGGSTMAEEQSSKTLLKESFIGLRFATSATTHPPPPPPRSNRDSSEDYTEVFLSHARLYVFAEKYDIQPLKALAIQQLHQTLGIYTLYLERAGDIIELLRYVHANTADVDGGAEALRALLVYYIGLEMDILVKAPEFKELLLEDGGALLGDFLRMVGKRIET